MKRCEKCLFEIECSVGQNCLWQDCWETYHESKRREVMTNERKKDKTIRYVFLITFDSGHQERVGFFAESEQEARDKATEWAEGCSVGDCVERWTVDN
jgi:ribulose bisphosphate carboxylase small subunit